jgi:hypothetical protein
MTTMSTLSMPKSLRGPTVLYPIAGPASYVKTAPVWAERAEQSGTISTTEGATTYLAGDYLVSNDVDDHDRYAIAAITFERLYEAADEAKH